MADKVKNSEKDSRTPAAGQGGTVSPLRKPVPCPICKAPSRRASYPFCSKRCADIDLSRWFTGRYAIATEEKATPPADPEGD